MRTAIETELYLYHTEAKPLRLINFNLTKCFEKKMTFCTSVHVYLIGLNIMKES